MKRQRPVTILVLIITTAFTGISIFTYLTTKNSIEDELIHSSLPLLSESIYSELQNQLIHSINYASTMAKDTFLISWVISGESDPKQIQNYLNKIKTDYNLFTAFYISEQSKNYYYHDGILKKIDPDDVHDQWYYLFMASEREYVLDVDTNEASEDKLTIFINHRLEDLEGNSLGVIGVGIELQNLSKRLVERGERHGKTIYLIDNAGLIQVHKDPEKIEKATVFSETGLKDDVFGLLDKELRIIEKPLDSNEGKLLISSRYIPELDWFIIIHQKESDILKPLMDNLKLNIMVGLITMILLIILSSVTISRYQKEMEKAASTDPLTEIFNRREFKTRFGEVRYRTDRYGISASLILIDLDDFKIINDTKGHLIGDQVLIQVSRIIKNIIRPDDIFARWGGDEFIILVENSGTDTVKLAERIRSAVTESKIGKDLNLLTELTMSMGIAEYVKGEVLNDLISRADRGLYRSKRAGKNLINYIES